MRAETSKPLTGGKGKGKGKGNHNGYGNGQGKGKGKKGSGQGYGKGSGKGGCEEVSPCTIKTSTIGDGTKKEKGNADPVGQLPPAHAAEVMEVNLRVAHQNTEWLRRVASAIDEKLLIKCRNSTTFCIPPGAIKALNEILLIRKSFEVRINDIVKQSNELSMKLHIDMTKFRDGANKIVDTTDVGRLTELLIQGKLSFGGVPLRSLLLIENDEFRNRIFQDHGAEALPSFKRLTYGETDHMFAVLYETNMGACEIVFSVGLDGRAVQPHVNRSGDGSRDIVLLSEEKADELAKQDARTGTFGASQTSRTRSSTTRMRSSRMRA